MVLNKNTFFIFTILVSVIILAFLPGCVSTTDNIREGDKFFNESNYENAFIHYDLAVKENAKNADGWIKRGSALDKLGRYDEAIDSILTGINLNKTRCAGLPQGIKTCIVRIYGNRTFFSGGDFKFMMNTSNKEIMYCNKTNCLVDLEKIKG